MILSNHSGDPVKEMLEGWTMANPDVIALSSHGHVVRVEPKDENKVALVIGNGTGHEPAMVGFVGPGLMDLNVPGPIFAAPGGPEIAKGLMTAGRGAGVLLCVSNHAGDVLAADLAVELLEDAPSPPRVRTVILGEDLGSPVDNRADRRGGTGLLFVWKILGAYAEAGHDLDACAEFALQVVNRCASLSATFSAGHHPISGVALAEIPAGHVLIGSGVHGEGSDTVAFRSVDELVSLMLDRLLVDPVIAKATRLGLVVNNAGALTGMELAIVARSAMLGLGGRGVDVERRWFGSYATTQDTVGFALAVCAVDDVLLRYYDSPARAVSWTNGAAITGGAGS